MQERIGNLRGKVTGMRVLAPDGLFPRMEVTVQAKGVIKGIEVLQTVTYWSGPRADGSLAGEGYGIDLLPDGQATSFKGSGVGRPAGNGMAADWRATIQYQPNATKLASLSEGPVFVDYHVDEEGNAEGTLYQLK